MKSQRTQNHRRRRPGYSPSPPPPVSPSPAPPLPRRGFTFIELLIVIGIICVLIALLLPAVQQAREAARRMQCQNNLFQLNTALQNYTLVHGVFPPGAVNPKGPIKLAADPDFYHMAWTVQILPQLEMQSVFQHFDFDHGVYDSRNAAPQQRMLAILDCPSSYRPQPRRKFGHSDYAGVYASTAVPIAEDNDGILHLNSHVSMGGIKDGSSYTIILGEKYVGDRIWGWASGTSDTLRNTGYVINAAKSMRVPSKTPGPAVGLIPPPGSPTGGPLGTTGSYGMGGGFAPAQAMPKVPAAELPDPALVPRGFSSRHAGGNQFAMADGSVRYISQNIDLRTFQQLASRAGGEMPTGI